MCEGPHLQGAVLYLVFGQSRGKKYKHLDQSTQTYIYLLYIYLLLNVSSNLDMFIDYSEECSENDW